MTKRKLFRCWLLRISNSSNAGCGSSSLKSSNGSGHKYQPAAAPAAQLHRGARCAQPSNAPAAARCPTAVGGGTRNARKVCRISHSVAPHPLVSLTKIIDMRPKFCVSLAHSFAHFAHRFGRSLRLPSNEVATVAKNQPKHILAPHIVHQILHWTTPKFHRFYLLRP